MNKVIKLKKIAASLRQASKEKFKIEKGESFSQLMPKLESFSMKYEPDTKVHVSGGDDDYITRKVVGYLENQGFIVTWDEPKTAAKKPYRVIVIDSKNKKVYEDTASGLSDLQKFVGGYIEIAHEWKNGKATDTLFVNEEGLLEMPEDFFEFQGALQPFAGSAVVVGTNHRTGDSVDASSSLQDIKSKVKFVSLAEVRRKYSKVAAEDIASFVQKNKTIAYDDDKKKKWKSLGQKFLKQVASKLDLKDQKIWFNAGGIAVSGDHHLMGMFDDKHGFHIFFNLDGFANYITYRTISHMKDYTGGANQNMPFSAFDDVNRVVSALHKLAPKSDEDPLDDYNYVGSKHHY
jgi:hypothetical protein